MLQLTALYEAFSQNRPSPLPELALQYGDYSLWQRGWVPEIASQQLAYWRPRLADAAQHDALETDRPRAEMQSYRGAMVKLALDLETSRSLKEVNHRLNVTLFMSLLATFYILLLVQSDEKDLTIATTSAGRHYSELETLMGYLLYTSGGAPGSVSQRSIVRRACHSMQGDAFVLGAMANECIPFSMLVKELVGKRNTSKHPFFQVMFSLEPPLVPLGPAASSPGWTSTMVQRSLTSILSWMTLPMELRAVWSTTATSLNHLLLSAWLVIGLPSSLKS